MRTLAGLLLSFCLLGMPLLGFAQTTPQAAPNPVVLTPGTAIDDLQVLMASAAERTSTAAVSTSGPNKNLYVQYSGNEYLSWRVSPPAQAVYRFFVLINAKNGEGFKLENTSTGNSVSFNAPGGWAKLDIGTLSLPSGISILKLTRLAPVSGQVQIKAVELIRDSDYPAYSSRVANSRVDTTWLSQSKYGLFFQYGSWGYPNNVGSRKSVDQQAKDFYVPGFVKMVKDSGASYVVWSFSWWGYRPDMPVPTVDAVIGDGSYTAQRNLIGEIAAALKAEGIRFVLYYHTGSEETAANSWWPKQSFPSSTFPSRGTGDRSVFFNNWSAVMEDIGTALGTNLDGYFFDDGMIYYPARFEELEAFARTGNPNRFVSWNSWVMPRFTDFQDVSFGEGAHGEAQNGSAPVGGNGVYTSGPHKGLLQHGMFILENWGDWGIHLQNQKIPATQKISNSALIGLVNSAAARGVPLSLNLSMYEDGTISEATLAQLSALRSGVYGTPVATPVWTTYNNNWANIAYTGTWTLAGNRNAGDYNNDVQWTSTNGSSAAITFTGTGITVYGPMSSSDGSAKVTLDGVEVSTLSASFNGAYTPQQHLIRLAHLANGPHTLTITKTGGSYLQLDKVSVATIPAVTWTDYNNNWSGAVYSGTWTLAGNRNAGDYNNDVQWTSANGNSVTVTFTGSGIAVYGPKSSADGTAQVALDGSNISTFSATSSSPYAPQQELVRLQNLSSGTHTLKLTKTGGTYLQMDKYSVATP